MKGCTGRPNLEGRDAHLDPISRDAAAAERAVRRPIFACALELPRWKLDFASRIEELVLVR